MVKIGASSAGSGGSAKMPCSMQSAVPWWQKNQNATCTPKVADILAFLIARDGHWATRDQLAHAAWKNGAVSDSGIDAAITRVRKALGEDSTCLEAAPRGHGAYELKAVQRLDGAETISNSQPAHAAEERTESAAEPESTTALPSEPVATRASDSRQTGTTVGYTAAGVIAVVVIVGGALGLLGAFDSRDASIPPWPEQTGLGESKTNSAGPATANAQQDPDVQHGALSTIGRNIFNEPNVSADWLSRVVSGNTFYLDPTTRAGVAYADGLHAYAQGDYERARQRIKAAQQAAPDTPDYKAGLIAVEAAAGNRDVAQALLDELNNAELEYPEPTRLAARLRYLTHAADSLPAEDRLDAFDDLLERMESVFAGSSTAVAGALAGRGHALAALERWDQAHRSFLDALAITETIMHSYSTWWRQTLIPALGRTAREGGHCDTENSRLENSLQLQTMMQKYSTLDAAIAIEAVRCLYALDRADDATTYLQALRTARQNGVLTEAQRSTLAELTADSRA
ncbi:hypothetical protein S4A8_02798 [Salinisphaera sp. S4-8]|uniref:winged helix-turn-helix domain-containing protein n=1 Tax=Salinisphaera sp. S4-8 TaxID=633357 RepID=UPI003341B2E2